MPKGSCKGPEIDAHGCGTPSVALADLGAKVKESVGGAL
jgi:hypothetical protein